MQERLNTLSLMAINIKLTTPLDSDSLLDGSLVQTPGPNFVHLK